MAWRLILLLAVLAAILTAALVPGAHPADAETRVGACLSAATTCTPANAGESSCTRPVLTTRSPGIAAGCCVATKVGQRGQFSIRNWDDYPQGVPRPTGELRLRTGAEYDRARSTANQANAQLRRSNPDAYRGKQIHEIHPVKFGGSPTDPANKIALTPQEHYRLNSFWMRHQRYAEGGP